MRLGFWAILIWVLACGRLFAQPPSWAAMPLPPEVEELNQAAAAAETVDAAARLYAQSLRFHPSNGPALHGFGLALLEQGRPADARRIFQRMDTLFPNDPAIQLLFARTTTRLPNPYRREIRQGLAAAQRVIEAQPDDPEGWYVLSLLWHLDGHYPAATEAIQQALQRADPDLTSPDTLERYQQQEAACHDAILVFSPLD